MLPVPSPDKGGGFPGEASNLPEVKITNAHRTSAEPRNRTDVQMTTAARNKDLRKRKPKKQLRVATWNIKSLNTREQELAREIKDKNIDICAIQETRKKGKGQMILGEYLTVYSGVKKESRAKEEVAILIHEKFKNQVIDCQYISERIVTVKIKFDQYNLNIIGVYGPENCRTANIREEFYEKLQQTLDQLNNNEPTIILGDFNARIGNQEIPGIKQRFNEYVQNENGDLLINFCANNEVRINNTFFNHKDQHKYTFANTRGQKSMIDYILTNRKIHPSKIMDVRCLTSADLGSDHSLVLCKIKIDRKYSKNNNTTNITHIETKIKVEGLQDESTKFLYQKRLHEEISKNQILENDDIEKSWIKIKYNIKRAAVEALGERQVKRNNPFRRKTLWFCEEVKEKCEEKKKAFLQYRAEQTQRAYNHYKRIRNETHALVRRVKEQHWEKFSKQMEHDFYGTQKEIWRMIRGQRSEMRELIEVKHIDDQTWVNYLKSLYSKEEEDPDEQQRPEIVADEQTTITQQDVEEALAKLKNRKAAGKDGIQNELLKYGGPTLMRQITELIKKVIKNNKIPQEWRSSILILMFKKGEKNDPRNYRGINLLNTTLKLTTKIITNKLNTTITLSDEQQGFRSGRSCTDATFVIRQLKEKALEYNRPAYVCFIDLTKAFDRVSLNDVIHLLYRRNVPLDLIKTIEDIYQNNIVEAKIDGKLHEPIEVNAGVRQGDSLSPLLFNLIMDEIITKVKTRRGYQLGSKQIKIICYADDAVLAAENEDDLQRMLNQFNITAKQFNMEISPEKTKSMVISTEPIRCKLEIEGKLIEQVMEFKYLGITVSSYGDLEKEVQEQVIKANRVAGCLNDTIWRNKYMRRETKSRVYKTVVRPIMTYSAETRPDTTRTQRMLQTAEMKILRRMDGKTLRDRVRNQDIRDTCKITNINEWIKGRRSEWNQHISRMAGNRLVKIARDHSPRGRRSTGRPRKRWNDDL